MALPKIIEQRGGFVPLLLGGVYLVVGLLAATLAKSAASTQTRTAWRLAAWAISAVAFAMHIFYEQRQPRHSPRTSAWRASLGVGLGAFGIAFAAWLHAQMASPQQHFPGSALAIWPVMTALPAFVVALVFAAALERASRQSDFS